MIRPIQLVPILLMLIFATPVLAETAETTANRVSELIIQLQFKDAHEAVDKALETHNNNEQLLLQKGFILVQLGLLEEAKKHYQDLMVMLKHSPEPWNNLAMVYRLQGNSESALDQFRQTIIKFPDFTQAHENLGDTYIELAGNHYHYGAAQLKHRGQLFSKAELIRNFNQVVEENTAALKAEKPNNEKLSTEARSALQSCEAELAALDDQIVVENVENEERIAQLTEKLDLANGKINDLESSLSLVADSANQSAGNTESEERIAQLMVDLAAANTNIENLESTRSSAIAIAVQAAISNQSLQFAEVCADSAEPLAIPETRKGYKSIFAEKETSEPTTSETLEASVSSEKTKAESVPDLKPAVEPVTELALANTPTPIATFSGDPTIHVLSSINSWVTAWNNRDIDSYLSHFAENFKPQKNIANKDWADSKRKTFSEASFISVKLEQMIITPMGENQVTVKFRQIYESDSLKEQTFSSIVLEPAAERWLIISQQDQTAE